ncbi:unnamed protein product [Urochloa decumbens]|uniref:DUF6598 domain-containing protein n=2 Tax=Urochloa decumbens TaxID=240449 RepID=A0ABC8XEF9_9POAL
MDPEMETVVSDREEREPEVKDDEQDIFNDCSVPARSSAQRKKPKLSLGKPDVVAETSAVKLRNGDLHVLWKIGEQSATTIEPMRNWQPSVTCQSLCKCYPAQALQVYGFQIQYEDKTAAGQADISGFFAIRDYYDKRRISIFHRESENPSRINFTAGAGEVNVVCPLRGILYGNLVFEYDLAIKSTHGRGGMPQLGCCMEGAALYEVGEKTVPYSGSHKIIHAEIPVDGGKRMYLKFVRFNKAIEAQVTIEPSIGSEFCLVARMGDIADEIQLFNGKFVAAPDQETQFVLVVPFDEILELKFTNPSTTGKSPEQIYTYYSFYHGRSRQTVKLAYGLKICMEIKWSRM